MEKMLIIGIFLALVTLISERNWQLRKNVLRIVLATIILSLLNLTILCFPDTIDFCIIFLFSYEAYTLFVFFCTLILFAGGEPVIIALFINTSMSDSCYNFSVLGFYDIRFLDAPSLYKFYHRSVSQVLVLLPLPIMVSSLCARFGILGVHYICVVSLLSSMWCFYTILLFHGTIKHLLGTFNGSGLLSVKLLIAVIAVQQIIGVLMWYLASHAHFVTNQSQKFALACIIEFCVLSFAMCRLSSETLRPYHDHGRDSPSSLHDTTSTAPPDSRPSLPSMVADLLCLPYIFTSFECADFDVSGCMHDRSQKLMHSQRHPHHQLFQEMDDVFGHEESNVISFDIDED